jgi:hypothetical protein
LRCLLLGPAYEDPVRYGVNCERLLDEPVEEHPAGPRRAPVEPERGLIEVVVAEVLAIDGALVGAEEPSLEQRGHPVDARQQRVRVLAAAPDDQPAMAVARLWQDG